MSSKLRKSHTKHTAKHHHSHHHNSHSPSIPRSPLIHLQNNAIDLMHATMSQIAEASDAMVASSQRMNELWNHPSITLSSSSLASSLTSSLPLLLPLSLSSSNNDDDNSNDDVGAGNDKKGTVDDSEGNQKQQSYQHHRLLQSHFKQRQKQVWKAITNMETVPCFRSIPHLLIELFSILEHFQVNQIVANLFYQRMFEFILILGHPHHSVMQRCQQATYYGTKLTVTHTTPLAELLSIINRYLYRFTTSRAYLELMYGNDLSYRLMEYDVRLVTEVSKLIDIVDGISTLTFDKTVPKYIVLEDVRTQILIPSSQSIDQRVLLQALHIKEEDKGRVQEDFKLLALLSHKLETDARREISQSCYCAIKQQLLRDLWIDHIGDKRYISVMDFIEGLRSRVDGYYDCQVILHNPNNAPQDVFRALSQESSMLVAEEVQKRLHHALKGNPDPKSCVSGCFAKDDQSINNYQENSSFDDLAEESKFDPVVAGGVVDEEKTSEMDSDLLQASLSSSFTKRASELNAEREQCHEFVNTLAANIDGFVRTYNGKLSPDEIARISRHIVPNEYHILPVLQQLAHFISHNCVRLIPPKSSSDATIVWDGQHLPQLLEVLSQAGVVNIHGPEGAGKSAKMRSVVHNLPFERDVLWVDCRFANSEAELISRVNSQLHLHNAYHDDMFKSTLFRTVKSLRVGSMLVFDGIENSSIDGLRHFLKKIADALNPLLSCMCLVFITHTALAQDLKVSVPVYSLLWSRMYDESADALCRVLYPADPTSLRTAGAMQAGIMTRTSRFCSLRAIRMLAKSAVKDGYSKSNWDHIFYADISIDMTMDEALLACILLRGLPPFDKSLAWVFCRKSFHGDLLRWQIAWLGLIRLGWINHAPDFGYYVPLVAIPAMADIFEDHVTLQAQWEEYLNYWALQLARIHDHSADNMLGMTYYDHNRVHFRILFSCFVTTHHKQHIVLSCGHTVRGRGVFDLLSTTDNRTLAPILAGRCSRLSQMALSPAIGLALTEAITHCILDQTGISYFWAITDVAIEHIRHNNFSQAISCIEEMLAHYVEPNKRLTPCVAHALAVQGYAYSLDNQPSIAMRRYIEAIAIWGELRTSGADDERVISLDDKQGLLITHLIDPHEVQTTRGRLQELSKTATHTDDILLSAVANASGTMTHVAASVCRCTIS